MTTHKTKQTSDAEITASTVLDDLNTVAEKVTGLVGAAPNLTATQIRRAIKLRKGGEKVVTTIAALARQYGISVAAHPVDAMVANMAQASSLVPVHKVLVSLTKQVSDAIFQGNSEGYASATVHYAMLRRLAEMDGSVAATLEPVAQFFAARSQATEETKTPTTSATTSSTATTAATAPGTPGSTATAAQTAVPAQAPVSVTHS